MSTAPNRLPGRSTTASLWLWIERLMWASGIAACGFWMLASSVSLIGARQDLQRFAELKTWAPLIAQPNQQLWSPQRVRAWQNAIARTKAPLAVLRIRKIGLEVAVLEGTDEWTLNRAVGHIENTAQPGMDGNAAIAGHRDGFFRGLKDVGVGDVIDVETLTRVDTYRVQRTWIVEPADISVLAPTATPSITLVTCYPFYFIGDAPQRFIVRAVVTQTMP